MQKYPIEIKNYLNDICNKIISNENYNVEMEMFLKLFESNLPQFLSNDLTSSRWIELLEDMMYGYSQGDEVFLLDTLRFGILKELEK